MVSRREQIVSLNIFTTGRTQICSLAGGTDEATQKFTSATGARIPIVNRNFLPNFVGSKSVCLVNFFTSLGKQDRRRFAL
jgi:hypothetical protein